MNHFDFPTKSSLNANQISGLNVMTFFFVLDFVCSKIEKFKIDLFSMISKT